MGMFFVMYKYTKLLAAFVASSCALTVPGKAIEGGMTNVLGECQTSDGLYTAGYNKKRFLIHATDLNKPPLKIDGIPRPGVFNYVGKNIDTAYAKTALENFCKTNEYPSFQSLSTETEEGAVLYSSTYFFSQGAYASANNNGGWGSGRGFFAGRVDTTGKAYMEMSVSLDRSNEKLSHVKVLKALDDIYKSQVLPKPEDIMLSPQ